jgi:ribonuclease HI
MNPHEIECFLDSELVVQQLNGKYKVKDKELQQLCGQVQDMIFMKFVTFRHIPREQNTLADKLVNEALDEALWKYNN